MASQPGSFVVSLDFELMWGVRDHRTVEDYRENILGVRSAIPAILDLFDRYEIHATWATVGLLFCESRDEMLAESPRVRPNYRDPRLSPYAYLERVVGNDEREDPFHFAPSLIRKILEHANQEIGTHTFSHYYCLEPGQDARAFRADLDAAVRLATRFGVKLESIVFPRNQVHTGYLPVCRDVGLRTFRGNSSAWLHAGRRGPDETLVRRGVRLLDAYLPVSRAHSADLPAQRSDMECDVRASRFLRPYSQKLAALEPLRKRRIVGEMERIASDGGVYHLWWHPQNFGTNTAANLNFLRDLLDRFDGLRRATGMRSRTMAQASDEARASA